MTRRAFSYVRMSTDTQLKGHSLERQISMARSYAKEKGFELIEDFQDIGISAFAGANVTKGRLGQFLQAVKDGEIEKNPILLVESLDRLSRQDPLAAFNQFSQILQSGIEIHTIFDRQIYTAETLRTNPGQLFSSIGYMLRAHSESEDKSKRLQKKWASKRENINGKILTTICPAWLKANADKTGFDIISDRAATIVKIFDLCIDQDMGAYSIAKYLNAHIHEYPKFTKAEKRNRDKQGENKTGWQKSYIIKILNNPSVYGEFLPHTYEKGKRQGTEKIYTNYFPAVVSEERYLLAQARMSERLNKGGGRKGAFLSNVFTKLIFCKHCSVPVHFINKGLPPKGGKYLRCSNSIFKHSCKAIAWRYEEFEESFYEFVTEIEFQTALTKGNYQSKKSKLEDEQDSIKQKIKKLNAKFDSLLDFDADINAAAKIKLQDKINTIALEISDFEDKLGNVKNQLIALNEQNSEKTQEELIKAINLHRGTEDINERTELQRRIHNQIAKTVTKIQMYTVNAPYFPAEGVASNLDPVVQTYLKKQGIKLDENLNRYLATTQGGLAYQQMERYFVVYFKNGEERTVHPFLKRSWKFDERRFNEFRQNVEKNTKAKISRDKVATSKYKTRPVKKR